jgi:dihydropteroate synthase
MSLSAELVARINARRPVLMGILNVTPDSFSDGGRFFTQNAAIEHARKLIDDGAHIIDVGGESTRPGATKVDADVETARVFPLIRAIRAQSEIAISIDTSKPEVMRSALDAGANIVNDVNALLAPGAMEIVASSRATVCLMHKQGEPSNMQHAPQYFDVVAQVHRFLLERFHACVNGGIAGSNIWLDPGFGFGKTVQHNLTLLRRLKEFIDLPGPLLVGLSRKSFLGLLSPSSDSDRRDATIAANVLAFQAGACIFRVHDIAAARDALSVAAAVVKDENEDL